MKHTDTSNSYTDVVELNEFMDDNRLFISNVVKTLNRYFDELIKYENLPLYKRIFNRKKKIKLIEKTVNTMNVLLKVYEVKY